MKSNDLITEEEKKLLTRIKNEANQLPIPEELTPDNLEPLLTKKASKHRKPTYRILRYASLVACFLIAMCYLFTVNSHSVYAPSSKATPTLKPDKFAAKNYEEIYDNLSISSSNQSALQDSIISNDMGSTSNKDFSSTNNQVTGIEEGDLVKNDGTYLYYCQNTTIYIIETKGTTMKQIGSITGLDDIYEFYVQDNLLITISGNYNTFYSSSCLIDSIYPSNGKTRISVYDITNKSTPSLLKDYSQDGNIISSRISDGYFYLFTNMYSNIEMDKNEPSSFIPSIENALLPASDIYFTDKSNKATGYVLFSSFSLTTPKKLAYKKAYLSNADQFYVSKNNIYGIATTDATTLLTRFAYRKGNISYQAEGHVDGYINSTMSLDEYNGYLRVITTSNHFDRKDNRSTNNLFILDPAMKITGSITNLAKGERIYSARFLGDTGYFVTFRQVDPLFSVDLSNPHNPKILGELKVTGFSSYLHFYDENLLLGIGQEVNLDTNTTTGLKLSMFDISDPANVKEVHKLVLKDIAYAEILSNYKAIMIDTKKNLFGFQAYKNTDDADYYYLFSYDPSNGFQQENCLEPNTVSYGYDALRGAYIDNVFYFLSLNTIKSYDMTTWKVQNSLTLKAN